MKPDDANLSLPPCFSAQSTALPEVRILSPRVFGDARGFFMESYNARELAACGIGDTFVQDNHSRSAQGVLRGLHYQLERPQGKLVRVIVGEIFDVAVDLRRSSPRFGRWVGMRLSAECRRQLWVPPGFGHGFLVLSAHAEVIYKTTDYYDPGSERCIRWDDPDLAVDWPLHGMPRLSGKDSKGAAFAAAEVYAS